MKMTVIARVVGPHVAETTAVPIQSSFGLGCPRRPKGLVLRTGKTDPAREGGFFSSGLFAQRPKFGAVYAVAYHHLFNAPNSTKYVFRHIV